MRTIEILRALAFAGLALHCGAPPSRAVAPAPVVVDADARAGLDHLNRVRTSIGLHPVELDPEMSRKAELHARYLAANAGRPEIAGLLAHDEVMTLPGATADGAEAGHASVIAFDDAVAPEAIETWLSTLYHRTPLLRRDLRLVGIGHTARIHVLMVDRDHSPAIQPPVMFPTARDVPAQFCSGEVPEPRPAAWFGTTWAEATELRSGYPVTVTFDPRAQLANVRATLEDPAGPVEVAASWPAAPATSFPQGPVVAMLPRRPLRGGTIYRATVEATDRGVPVRLAWEFRTADAATVDAARIVPPPKGVPVVLEGVVESAYVQQQCESQPPTQCRARISIGFLRADPAAIAAQVYMLDGDTDADRVLGLVGKRIRASGFAEYPAPRLLEVTVANAAALEVSPEEPVELAAEVLGEAHVGTALRVTGSVPVVPALSDQPIYVRIGTTGMVTIQASADTWAKVFAQLGGPVKKPVRRQVSVRGVIRRGAPTADGLYIYVSHPSQVVVRASSSTR